MRFNKQELIALASQTLSHTFDHEGILILKEKQDGIFRRSEGYSEKWFRLRGNLLFFQRNTERLSEPAGLIVLGHHKVQLQDQDENGHWPFQIVWSNGESYRMATYFESDRSNWIKAIASSTYHSFKSKMCDLNEKLKKQQNIEDISTWRLQKGVVIDINEIPLCELALSCDNLLCDAYGQPPSPMIVVYVKYTNGLYVKYSSTEVIPKCSNPCFSRTILFRACDGLTGDAAVRIVVFDVKERVSDTKIPMGYASLLLSTIQEAQRLRIALTSRDKRTVGFLTLNGWSLEPSYVGTSPSHGNDRSSTDVPQRVHCHRRSQSLPPRLGLKLKFPAIDTLMKQNFVNSHLVTYRFHSGLGGDITVHEIMAESRLCYLIPAQLMEIYINTQKELFQEILSLGEMGGEWKWKQEKLIDHHTKILQKYLLEKARILFTDDNKQFKKSTEKGHIIESVPVNLHLQRMWVHNDTLNKIGFHDVVTVGAFTLARWGPCREGLLGKISYNSNNIKNKIECEWESKLQSKNNHIAAVKILEEQALAAMADLIRHVEGNECNEMTSAAEVIASKVRAMLDLWDPEAAEEALAFIGSNTPNKQQNEDFINKNIVGLWFFELQTWDVLQEKDYIKNKLQWFCKSTGWTPTSENIYQSNMKYLRDREFKIESYKTVRSDLESSLAAVGDCVQHIAVLEDNEERAARVRSLREHLSELSKGASTLLLSLGRQRAAARLRSGARLHYLDCHLEWRRNCCFSQALTAVTTGLLSWLCSTAQEVVARVLGAGPGPLCCFEGLLSLREREAAMWEDMAVAVEDLQAVEFQLVNATQCLMSIPLVRASPGGEISVKIPVSESLYNKLETDKRSLTVTAVFFNVGVNAQAARPDADTAAQAQSNLDNFTRLQLYADKYRRHFPEDQISIARASSRSRPLEEVMQHLRSAVNKKTPKNCEVLQLAAQATRQMNGVRFTSCKSAKDRTGMSVTLEQCAVLAAEYHLADHEKERVLDVLRSEGCRRENTFKNVGVRKYAFTKVSGLPQAYRPPPGTYGTLPT